MNSANSITLLDGAMGTMIFSRIPAKALENAAFTDAANLLYPDTVSRITSQYAEAGAQILRTNSFGSPALAITKQISVSDCYKMVEASASLARRGAADAGFPRAEICGTIGSIPASSLLTPENYAFVTEIYRECIHILTEEGCTMLSIETLANSDLLPLIAAYIPDGLTVSVSTFNSSPETFSVFKQEVAQYASSIGFNCVTIKEISHTIDSEIFTLPQNFTLLPSSDESPEIFTENLATILDKILTLSPQNILLGGCCGTTPHHIKCLDKLLKQYNSN